MQQMGRKEILMNYQGIPDNHRDLTKSCSSNSVGFVNPTAQLLHNIKEEIIRLENLYKSIGQLMNEPINNGKFQLQNSNSNNAITTDKTTYTGRSNLSGLLERPQFGQILNGHQFIN